MRRRAGPVQQWVDSIPSSTKPAADTGNEIIERTELEHCGIPPLTLVSSEEDLYTKPSMTVSAPITVPGSPVIAMPRDPSPITRSRLARDTSFQSDSSHCSSVESLLELRRADPEAILLGLGFGGCTNNTQENGPLSRIPKRFLQPSKLKGIDINDFIKRQQETSECFDSASLGYRGLTGSPYVAPSEIVQKIVERLREHETHNQDAYTVHHNEPYSPIFQDTSRLSVLSPNNRQFLERPRSKSPDMRNKRMIIGQKSFAFGCDGDLIEIDPLSQKDYSTNGTTENSSIDSEDAFLTTESFKLRSQSTMLDNENTDKSTISNGRQQMRLVEQISMDDSVEDLISKETNSRTEDELNSCTCEVSVKPSTSGVRVCENRWNARRDGTKNDLGSGENARRASEGSGDMKTRLGGLSRDEGRRYSDGILRQSTSLLDRRRSLKRQARISDAEAVVYESDSSSDIHVTEEIEVAEKSQGGESRTDETVALIKPLVKEDRKDESSTPIETLAEVEIPSEESHSSKKKVKKRSLLSTLRDMQHVVRSVKMEPGF